MPTVAVLFGGVSPEHDISILTGLQVVRALSGTAYGVESIYWAKTGEFYLTDNSLEAKSFVAGTPEGARQLGFNLEHGFSVLGGGRFTKAKELNVDAVLICLHGGAGEDGSIQALFDIAGIPYGGPGTKGAALGMDKLAFGGVLSVSALPSLPRQLLSPIAQKPNFDGPYIVKPRYGGSSIGIDVVADYETALARLNSNIHLRQGAVIEPYRPDLFDLQVAVRVFPRFEISAIEKPVRSSNNSEILSYKDKYVAGEGMVAAPRELPAKIPSEMADRVRDLAQAVAELLPIRGIARIDFLSDGMSELYINEVNTIPGSLSKYLFVDPHISFTELLSNMIEEAIKSKTYLPITTGADGTALSSAGSIAAKLA